MAVKKTHVRGMRRCGAGSRAVNPSEHANHKAVALMPAPAKYGSEGDGVLINEPLILLAPEGESNPNNNRLIYLSFPPRPFDGRP
jgi:hypothetical protein